jgi:hypothetical protein
MLLWYVSALVPMPPVGPGKHDGVVLTGRPALAVVLAVVGSSNPGTLSDGVTLSVTSASVTIGWTSTASFFCVKLATDGQNFFPFRTWRRAGQGAPTTV